MNNKKRLLTLFLSLAMVLSMIPALAFSTSAADTAAEAPAMLTSAQALEKLEGSGTAEAPYLIQSTQDWIWLAVASYNDPLLGKHFKQTADLDFSVYFKNVANGIPTDNTLIDGFDLKTQYGFSSNNSEFFMLSARKDLPNPKKPTETADYTWFAGNYDGQGYSVSGLYINTDKNIGLIRQCAGGTIENVVLKNSVFQMTGNTHNSGIGGIVGEVRGLTDKSAFDANDPGQKDGQFHSTISGCVVESTVQLLSTGGCKLGGIVGGLGTWGNARYAELTISNCTSKANISIGNDKEYKAHVFAGGIIGANGGASMCIRLNDCVALGIITAQTPIGDSMFMVGGIAGDLSGTNAGGHTDFSAAASQMSHCYADVDITINKVGAATLPTNANCGVGGLIGSAIRTAGATVLVEDCYAGGTITDNVNAEKIAVGSVIGRIVNTTGTVTLTNVKYTGTGNAIGAEGKAPTGTPATVAKPFDKNSGEASLSLSEEKVGVQFIFRGLGNNITAKLNGESYPLPQAVDGKTTVTDDVPITELDQTSKLELAVKVEGIEKAFTVPYRFGALDYANSADEKTKPVVNALLQYGKYAANYFDETAEALPDVEAVELENRSSHDDTKGLIYAGSSLLITDGTVLRHYFTLAEGKKATDFALTVDGKALTLTQKGDTQWYYVEFAVKAADLGKPFEVKLGNDVILTHSVLDYCAKAVNDKENSKLVNLVKTLYFYEVAANDFFTAG